MMRLNRDQLGTMDLASVLFMQNSRVAKTEDAQVRFYPEDPCGDGTVFGPFGTTSCRC